jgi:hypothetical protein
MGLSPEAGLADLVVPPPEWVPEAVPVKAQASVEVGYRYGDRVYRLEQGSC